MLYIFMQRICLGAKMNSRKSLILPQFIVFIVFLILKLTSVITWSWLWVTSPLWAPFALVIGILALISVPIGVLLLVLIIVEWNN